MLGRRALVAGAAAIYPAWARAQQKRAIRVARQPSIIYMPTYIMETEKLIEAHAARLGVPGVTVEWITFNGGGGVTDALLADGVDLANTGVGNMLLLWDRTKGRVKGIAATCAEPLVLISRNPRIRTLADFRPGDKIAVPTIKVSTQAILLSMAAERLYGTADAGHFDPMTVQLGHPDAVAAMLNPNGEIDSHFTAPPFFADELKRVPGAHVVTTSADILGHKASQALLFTTVRFADANPILVQAAKAAVADALDLVHQDPAGALRLYKAQSGDPLSPDELTGVLEQPGMSNFLLQPQGTLEFARYLHAAGILKTEPGSWKDYFLPIAYDLDGS